MAEWKLKRQAAEGRNGSDSAVLRVLEHAEAAYRLRAFTTGSQTVTACAENQRKLCEADGITPELSRTDLRRRIGATYHGADPTPRSGVGLNEQLGVSPN